MSDYVAGKAAWMAAGLPTEGSQGDARRVGALAAASSVAADVELRLTSGGLLDALVDPTTGEVDLDPVTVRPSLPVRDLVDRWRKGDLHADHVVVTTAAGAPVGVLARQTVLDLAKHDRLP